MAKKDFFGAKFVCVFEISTGAQDKKERWALEVIWYSATGEAKQVGPGKLNSKGNVRVDYPVPLGVFLFAQAQVFALANWLRDVFVQAAQQDPMPQPPSEA